MAVITDSVGRRGRNRRPDVLTIEKLLHENGYLGSRPNRRYTTATERAIRAFQRSFVSRPTGLIEPDSESENKLIALNPVAAALSATTAVVEILSLRTISSGGLDAFWGPGVASMIAGRSAYYPPKPGFSAMPHAQREAQFGSFDFEDVAGSDSIRITRRDTEFDIVGANIPQLASVPLLSGGFRRNGRIRCHRLAVPRFRALFAAWQRAGLMNRINHFSGPYVARYKRGVTHDGNARNLSNHAWGTAIDFNVPQNRLGRPPARLGGDGCLLELVPIANDLGFYWGGHFSGRLDGMHFEIAQL